MYNEIYKYYDLIQAGKDYELECNFIRESYSRYGPAEPLKILDIGCGTGTHSLILAEESDSVLGLPSTGHPHSPGEEGHQGRVQAGLGGCS